jgi:hypothetical protein
MVQVVNQRFRVEKLAALVGFEVAFEGCEVPTAGVRNRLPSVAGVLLRAVGHHAGDGHFQFYGNQREVELSVVEFRAGAVSVETVRVFVLIFHCVVLLECI